MCIEAILLPRFSWTRTSWPFCVSVSTKALALKIIADTDSDLSIRESLLYISWRRACAAAQPCLFSARKHNRHE